MGLFILLVGATIIFVVAMRDMKAENEWNSGFSTWNSGLRLSELMEAYIALGARFIQVDRVEAGAKIRYMHNHFEKKFFEYSYQDFISSLRHASQNPIKLRTVSIWLNKHLPHKADRLQVLYFLAGLSMVDGSFNSHEMKMLRELNDFLGLSLKDFESVIAMYRQKEKQTEERTESYSTRTSRIAIAARILGVSENASMDEIKKAYRKLVKLHHPDRFATESIGQQELAKERFVEIQKAYEVMERFK